MPSVSRYRKRGQRRVPYNLEFYPLAVEFDGTDLEVNADGGNKGRCPCVVAEPKQQTGLSNTFDRVKGCRNCERRNVPESPISKSWLHRLAFSHIAQQLEEAYLDEKVIMGRRHGVLLKLVREGKQGDE